jgi:hypothetical protein
MVLASALGLALRGLGFGEVTVILALAVAGIGLVMVAIMAFGEVWSTIAAIILIVTPPFAVTVVIDVQLAGPIVAATVAEAPQSRWAAGFQLSDATLRTDLAATVTTARRGRNGTFYDSFTAAPVVGPDWRRGQLVAVWAIADGTAAPAEWSSPSAGGLLRLVPDDRHDEVIDRLMRRRGLGTLPEAVIGRWAPDPAAALGAAWLALAEILGAAGVAWSLSCLLVRPAPPEPRGARRG